MNLRKYFYLIGRSFRSYLKSKIFFKNSIENSKRFQLNYKHIKSSNRYVRCMFKLNWKTIHQGITKYIESPKWKPFNFQTKFKEFLIKSRFISIDLFKTIEMINFQKKLFLKNPCCSWSSTFFPFKCSVFYFQSWKISYEMKEETFFYHLQWISIYFKINFHKNFPNYSQTLLNSFMFFPLFCFKTRENQPKTSNFFT
jgi:hypothetical protein